MNFEYLAFHLAFLQEATDQQAVSIRSAGDLGTGITSVDTIH